MTPIQEPVTGHEEISDLSEPQAALGQFYRALNTRDIALMQQNWDATDEAAMDNPLGGLKRGWAEIRSAYERLFAGANRYQFEFYDYTLQRFGQVFPCHRPGTGETCDCRRPTFAPGDPHHASFSLSRR